MTLSGYVRHAGAAGLFGRVSVQFERFHGEQAITVVNRLDPEKVPAALAAAAEQGIRGAFSSAEGGGNAPQTEPRPRVAMGRGSPSQERAP